MITTIISAIKTATSLEVYPFATETLTECVVYEWNPESDNGVVAQDRLMIRIKANSMAHATDYAAKVKKALLTWSDEPKNGYNKVEVNGGGTLKDTATGLIDLVMYFDLTHRSEALED